MKKNKCSFVKNVLVGLFCILFLVGSSVPALCAPKKPKKDKTDSTAVTETPEAPAETPTILYDVEVYAEGAYTYGTGGDLAVYIYANINVGDLCSYGVKLNYATAKLEIQSAAKNEAVWYMGTTGDKKTYMDPDTSTAGKIIFIGGKLDEDSPTAGVTGTRILLGWVTFSRIDGTETDDPDDGGTIDPADYFGITLELGRADPYDNFVTTGGDVKDDTGVSFVDIPPIVRERGDANADGEIDVVDYVAIRNNINSTDYPPYMDCNDDGAVDVVDYVCIRNKI